MATESKKAWWQDPSVGLDLIRIYLGIGLMVRGALFISQPEVLLDFLKRSHSWFVPLALSQYVVAAAFCWLWDSARAWRRPCRFRRCSARCCSYTSVKGCSPRVSRSSLRRWCWQC